MRPIQRLISIGFATTAIAAASMPALSWTVWPDVDFEWYANVGRTATTAQPSTVQGRDETLAISSQQAASPDTAYPPAATEESRRPIATSSPEGRIVPSLPDVETVSPTLPYSGSNRR